MEPISKSIHFKHFTSTLKISKQSKTKINIMGEESHFDGHNVLNTIASSGSLHKTSNHLPALADLHVEPSEAAYDFNQDQIFDDSNPDHWGNLKSKSFLIIGDYKGFIKILDLRGVIKKFDFDKATIFLRL